MRKCLWQVHSWMGLIAGAGLLIIGLTGSLLVFREEIEGALHPARTAAALGGQGRLGFDALFARVRSQLPGQEIVAWDSIMHKGAADALAVVHLDKPKEWRWTDADPFTGQLFAEESEVRSRAVFSWLLRLHANLLLGDWGAFVAGVLAALLCLLGVSGVFLCRHFWRSLFTLRCKRSARIFFSDLHKMVGISSVVFNLILGFTGAWWNLPVLKDLIRGQPKQPEAPGAVLYNPTLSVDALLKEAARRLPGLNPSKVYINFPTRTEQIEVRGSVVPPSRIVDEYNSGVTFDAQTGEVIAVDDFRNGSLWSRIEMMMRPLHFGTFGGVVVKMLWCVLALAPGVLAISGFAIWYRRRSVFK